MDGAPQGCALNDDLLPNASRKIVVEIVCVGNGSKVDLSLLVHALDIPTTLFGQSQRGQQEGNDQSNDGHHEQNFNQREGLPSRSRHDLFTFDAME